MHHFYSELMTNKTRLKPALSLISDEMPIERFLTYRILRLNSKLNRQGAAILRQTSGLKMPEWRVVAFLGTRGKMTATMISEVAGVDPGLLSRSFRSLELAGLIETRRPDHDRREVHATLTRKGQGIFDKTIPLMSARQRALLDALDPDERAAIFRIIDKLELVADASPLGGKRK